MFNYRSLPLTLTLSLSLCLSLTADAATLTVGSGQQYSSLELAAQDALPGDTIIVKNGVYTRKQNISNLHGRALAPIIILGENKDSVIWRGGNEAWHLTDVSYLYINGFVFERQKVNGVNIDDGGTYESPSHHITLENCIFRDMDASGNNDLLKLSGLDDFVITKCNFLNGSAGGSGADMVGCHRGRFLHNRWENMGSNCIQAKGGTQYIEIRSNWFIHGGQRALNLGGSTGLQFFRPIDAPFEAADIQVYTNVFVGSTASLSYTGSVRVSVVNNTIYHPERWVFRILQETVDTTRFAKCGDNEFINNLIVVDDKLHRAVNVGSNTAPETFRLSNNLWYHEDDNSFVPSLPVADSYAVLGENPLFADAAKYDFHIDTISPAAGAGLKIDGVDVDMDGMSYHMTPSIGAYEGNFTTSHIIPLVEYLSFGPNPAINELKLFGVSDKITVRCYDLNGRLLGTSMIDREHDRINVSSYPRVFVLIATTSDKSSASRIIYRTP